MSVSDETSTVTDGIILSDAAAAKVKTLLDQEGREDLALRENLSRKGNLLKNIFHQARNLKNGDPVELATLGVDKGKIQEETRELKQKLTNVISL